MQSVREFDIIELYKEARNRWLKPTELLFLLQNYEKQHLTQETPQYPSSGSLFLFNRRVHRFFRKDGHVWRKKRDGRTIGEAHERLKVGNVDTLNCYYAHGEQNPNFQRRCYWILDPAWADIVLVHYREVTEGFFEKVAEMFQRSGWENKLLVFQKGRYSAGSILNFSMESNSPFSLSVPVYNAQNSYEQCWSSHSPGGSLEEVCSNLFPENNDLGPLVVEDGSRGLDTSSGQEVSQALRRLAEQLSLDGDDNSFNFLEKLPPYCSQNEVSQDSGVWAYEKESSPHIIVQDDPNRTVSTQCTGEDGQLDGPEIPKDSWKGILELYSNSFEVSSHEKSSDKLTLNGVPVQNFEIGLPLTHAASSQNDRYLISSSQEPKYPSNTAEESEVLSSHGLSYCLNDTENSSYYPASGKSLSSQLSAARRFLLDSDDPIDSPTSSNLLQEVEKFTLSTYSSGTSILGTNSSVAMFPKTISIDSTQTTIDNNNKLTPDYYGTWFDQESCLGTSLGSDSSLTVAQVQRFRIREVSPDWSYSDSPEATKVIITGDFLCNSSEFSWACMFDGIEVPVEIIQEGVFRCHAPSHSSGKVSLCITSGNRESCSEVREFEFRSKPHDTSIQQRESETPMDKEELVLLVRFAQVLLHGFDSLSVQKEDCAESETQQFRKWKIADDPWGRTIEELLFGGGTPFHTMKWILEELLKDKLQHWVSSRHKEGGEATRSLSKLEQGMIHMIAALGYEWALYPILTSGVGINFRDVNGWTALHWAAQFGREKMVAALIAAGAAAGAVTDPTSQDPSGKSPASVASASGHKGLAGYLSEVALTSYLSSLTLEENEISKGSAAVEAEQTVDIICKRNAQILTGAIEDELSLKDSLAAVRNAAQAAARIQAAFRTHSFRRRRQRAALCCDEYGMTPEGISALSKMQRAGWCHPDHSLSKAALSIQKNYRGWKRRKEFLNLRQNVVKIQAHVRGHQVRKYRELIWTVGILEKAILRWRRRRVGLRGFRAEQEPIVECEEQEEDILKVFRKHKVDAALINDVTRVLSMAESPEARQQYRRLQESYRQAKAELSIHTTVTTSSSQGNGTDMEDEDYMYHFT